MHSQARASDLRIRTLTHCPSSAAGPAFRNNKRKAVDHRAVHDVEVLEHRAPRPWMMFAVVQVRREEGAGQAVCAFQVGEVGEVFPVVL